MDATKASVGVVKTKEDAFIYGQNQMLLFMGGSNAKHASLARVLKKAKNGAFMLKSVLLHGKKQTRRICMKIVQFISVTGDQIIMWSCHCFLNWFS